MTTGRRPDPWAPAVPPRRPDTLGPGDVVEQLRAGLAVPPGVPELAVAVIAFRSQPGLADAVASLVEQDLPVEVVLVNSGGGDPGAALRTRGLDVPVVHREEPLRVGAARNLGIEATRAPYLAFLAADCLAEPGWVRGRLTAHRAGALCVATAMTNAHPDRPSAWASYALQHHTRMPGYPPEYATRTGSSYARTIFEHFGRFREDLDAAEDTELNARFAGLVEIAWAPAVRTAHRYPESAGALLRDQYRRGRRTVTTRGAVYGRHEPWRTAARALQTAPYAWERAWRAAGPDERRGLGTALPLVLPAAVAYALGAITAPRG